MTLFAFITRFYARFLHDADWLRPVLLLLARLQMARVFWASGMVKIADWNNTLALFADEYKVPHLPPQVAALSATAFELSCPVLLVLGLATRLATLPMLVMTAVIYFTYDSAAEHIYWALVLGMLLTHGAGRFSVDDYVARKFGGRLTVAPAR